MADSVTINARVLLEVVAGLIPGQPMDEYTRQWAISEEQWHARKHNDTTVERIAADCDAYAVELRNGGLNWVQTTWIYL